ncbi:MAG TPA: class I SAM-dependent methyltransferase [Candidatus Angelobacter sp.]|nr:class I SAM-dependent methyltransferase [Candidatus Angelobacter sp.]
MKDSQDAYGHQLYDFFRGRQVVEVVERDDGLIDPSEALPKYYLSEYKDWTPREKLAAQYVRGRVLDIGCGGGRWSLYLQKKGQDVLGIDISSLAVKVCRQRGLRNVMVKSISDIDSGLGKFETILMMGNNFGLFGNPKQAKRLLKRFHYMTSPGARIIAESLDIYKPPVDPVHRQYHLRNRRLGRMPGQVRIRIRYSVYTSPWFDYLLVSKSEMKWILRGTGWEIERFIESEKGPAYVGVIRKTK